MWPFGPSNSELQQDIASLRQEVIKLRSDENVRYSAEMEQLGKVNTQLTTLSSDVTRLGSDEANRFVTLLQQLLGLKGLLRRIEVRVKRIDLALTQPGALTLIAIGENGMDQISFQVQLPEPPPKPNDIVGGELLVVIGTTQLPPISTTLGQSVVSGDSLVGAEGTTGTAEFRYVDNAGNRSAPSTMPFTLSDTFAPVAPGTLGIIAVGETFEEPAPVPTEPTTPTEPTPTEPTTPAEPTPSEPATPAEPTTPTEPTPTEPTTPSEPTPTTPADPGTPSEG